MNVMNDKCDNSVGKESASPRSLAVIGWAGHNAQSRVAPALRQQNGRLRVTGYDLRQPPSRASGVSCAVVRDNRDLATRLCGQRPETVLIESTDEDHPEHIRLALDSGALRVITEKCLAASAAEAAELAAQLAARWTSAGRGVERNSFRSAKRPNGMNSVLHDEQQVFVLDHYLTLELVVTLFENRERWLGEVRRIVAVLFEEQGVPAHQVRSHRHGMGGFLHHIVALAALFCDLENLVPVAAEWARHPDSPVPDTYRAIRLASRRTGRPVVEGAVGKYMQCPVVQAARVPNSQKDTPSPCLRGEGRGEGSFDRSASPRKHIYIEGTRGAAWLNRDRCEMRVMRSGAAGPLVLQSPDYSGYRTVARSIATGEELPTLLSVAQAVRVLELIEQGHRLAEERSSYPDRAYQPFQSRTRPAAA